MKKLFFLGAFLLFAGKFASAQDLYFSCDTKEVCYWNSSNSKYEDCSTEDFACRFKVNKDETMFEHQTPTLKSTYYVSHYEYDKENDVYVYDVTSDVGNKYTYIFDIKDDEIRVVNTADVDNIYMITFHIKSSWSE